MSLSHRRQRAAQRTRDAVEARERLQEFLGVVAHDMRQPVTTVLGYPQLLLRRHPDRWTESELRTLKSIEDASRRMRRLIDDLPDAARIGAGRLEIRSAPMDLAALTRQVVDEVQRTTTTHRLRLEAPDHLIGRWDRDRMAQVFTNLITNAIEYSPSGGEVCVGVSRTNEAALIRVSDQGAGMPVERLPLLFQPFVRLEPGRRHRALASASTLRKQESRRMVARSR